MMALSSSYTLNISLAYVRMLQLCLENMTFDGFKVEHLFLLDTVEPLRF